MTTKLAVGEAFGAEAQRLVAGVDRKQRGRRNGRFFPVCTVAGQATQQGVQNDDWALSKAKVAVADVNGG
jgi:hypothetical protein